MAINFINTLKFGDNSYNLTLPYGICTDASTVYARAVTVDNSNLTLEDGARIAVKFSNILNLNGTNIPTLKVNSLDAKPIKAHGETLSVDYYWAAGQVVELIYANDAWHILGSPQNTNIDTKVTSVENHYTPSANSSYALSADASSTTAATWNSTSLVTGVNLQRDAKGHVTGITLDSIKMPSNPNTNTSHTHSAGLGLSGSGSDGTSSGKYTYKVALVNETPDSLSSVYYAGQSNRFYAVQIDKDGKLAVTVPWIAYSAAGTALGLVKSGGDVTITNGEVTVVDDSHSHSSSTITGTLTTSQIPSLSASKITSGTFDEARIPSLSASKITSGTFDEARIPNINISKLYSTDGETIPSNLLPSYVDDVLEGNYYANGALGSGNPEFVLTGAGSAIVTPESGKIYVDIGTNKTYRWSGTTYVEISASLAIGTTASTAAAGNHTHTTAITSTTSSADITLSYGSSYKLETGGTSKIFKMPSAYSLPTASATSLGGVKIGSNINISNGKISVNDASASQSGLMPSAYYTKITNIEDEAQVNIIESISSNGTALSISNKAVNIPSASTSAYGVTKLSDSVASTSTVLAATANAVRVAYNLAASKTNNTGTVTSVTGGKGLTGTITTSGSLNVGAGTGIIVNDDDVALDTNYIASTTQNGLMSSTYYAHLINHKHSISYTPEGTINAPGFTATNSFTAATGVKSASTTTSATTSTTTVNSITSAGGLEVNCYNKCLTLTFTAPTSSPVTVPKSDHTHSATTSVILNTGIYTPTGTVAAPTFTGVAATLTSGSPNAKT